MSKAVIKRAFVMPEKAVSLKSDLSDHNKVPAEKVGIPHDFIPSTEEEMVQCLADPLWRICSGHPHEVIVTVSD